METFHKEKASGSRNYMSGFGKGQANRTRSQNFNGFYNGGIASKTVKGYPEENLQLVPCRWSHTGWKYVQTDPDNTQFF